MSDDAELERLKQKKLQEMLARQNNVVDQTAARGGTVIELDGANFDQTVRSDRPTLVDFWAAWCGPCKAMHPVFEKMADVHRFVTFGRLNIDQNQNIAARFGVQSIPTFMMFRGGRIVTRVTGAVGEAGIQQMISSVAGSV